MVDVLDLRALLSTYEQAEKKNAELEAEAAVAQELLLARAEKQAENGLLNSAGRALSDEVHRLRAQLAALTATGSSAPPTPPPAPTGWQQVRELIEKWQSLGESELSEACEKNMPAAMGVAAMRLHCARELLAVLPHQGAPTP